MGGEQLAIEYCLMLYDTPWIKDPGMATNQDVMLRCPWNICSSPTHETPLQNLKLFGMARIFNRLGVAPSQ